MAEQRITVVVRIRPTIERERYEPVCARKADDDQTIVIKVDELVTSVGGASAFQFDHVFDETDDQVAVYEESVQEMIDHALSGFNTTVFTYGQTGSGKTFTILGSMSPDGRVTEKSGAFLRVFDDLFKYREATKDRLHILVALSALELYVDDAMDLLSNRRKLKLRETPEETVMLGIRIVEVTSMEDVIRYFEIANSFRSVTATKMNDTSSRSHALFFIDLFQIPMMNSPHPPQLSQLVDENGMFASQGVSGVTKSRIALVDLAGSERVKRSGAQGQAMVEAQAINKSLSTLGTVINAMYIQNPHIPFREAKLTKLLKPCFVDPTSRLLLIGQVAPPSNSASESLGTLRFCDRVKGLKAGPVAGFSDPVAEEAFLQSRRVSEELLAEMHILQVQHYYNVTNVHRIAAIKRVTVKTEQQRVVSELQAGAADLVARKESEAMEKGEREATAQRDAEVESFILHMNALIDEYEGLVRATKKEKKSQKKLHEEQEAEQDAMLHEAKKAKKLRLKMEESVAEVKQRLEAAEGEEQSVEQKIEAEVKEPVAGLFSGGTTSDVGSPNTAMDGAVEEATHALVESFYNHATEQSRLYSLYVSRLAATGRERSQVRRMKLMSSSLVTDGTLLYDLIAFLVDRAVDTSEGDIVQGARWGWHDVDGLSQRLLNADELYPPLLPSVYEPLDADAAPCSEMAHSITFLSSDESDGEHSHHAAESRRIRQMRDAAATTKLENGISGGTTAVLQQQLEQKQNHRNGNHHRGKSRGDTAETESVAAEEREEAVLLASAASAPLARPSEWMNGQLSTATPPPDASLVPAAVEGETLTPTRKSRRHGKRRSSVAAAQEGVDDLLQEAAASPDVDPHLRNGNVSGVAMNPKKRPSKLRKGSSNAIVLTKGDQAERSDSRSSSRGSSTSSRGSGSGVGNDEKIEDKEAAATERPSDASSARGSPEEVVMEKHRRRKKGEKKTSAQADREAGEDAVETGAPNLCYEDKTARGLMTVYDSPTLVQDLIRFLRSGSRMMKHCRHGKPHARIFWISTQRGEKELFWKEPESRNADHSCIHLSDVRYIQLGCFSKIFRRHPILPNNPAFFRCFTIGLKHGGRTVDIVAETLPDYEAWVVGLAHLVGVDPFWGGKIDLTAELGANRLTYFESGVCETNYIRPTQYLELKKCVQQVASQTLKVLTECGDDVVRAQEILCGIHPPAVNGEGAVLMTKGELRFLLADTFDILRISRLWLLFQQLNLIYDDNFTPATAFGITERPS